MLYSARMAWYRMLLRRVYGVFCYYLHPWSLCLLFITHQQDHSLQASAKTKSKHMSPRSLNLYTFTYISILIVPLKMWFIIHSIRLRLIFCIYFLTINNSTSKNLDLDGFHFINLKGHSFSPIEYDKGFPKISMWITIKHVFLNKGTIYYNFYKLNRTYYSVLIYTFIH